jgi:CBS domain containing-hemolysin-like protein
MDPDLALSLLAVALLATNAYFVTAEFTLLAPQRAGADLRSRAERVFGGLLHPEELLLMAQLGRGAATLLLGYAVARHSLRLLGAGPLGEAGAVAAALALAALAHTVLAAQLPKQLGVHLAARPTASALLLPLAVATLALRPLAWVLLGTVHLLGRVVGMRGPAGFVFAPTAEQIRHLVAEGHARGVVESDEQEMIAGVFEFSETVAREVMTPRIDVVAAPVDVSLAALVDLLVSEGHSRLPIYEGTIDSIVGVLLAKDLLPMLADPDYRERAFDVRAVMRAPYFVPDTKPVDDLLAEFRQQKVHLAVVLDEFGGTYGLVTMEDLLEEIVGDINDEYDDVEPEFAATPEGDVLIDGGALISEVNERLGLGLPEEDFDTIGGFVFGALGRVPEPGDVVEGLGADGALALQVDETEDRRVTRLRLTRTEVVEVEVEEVAADE